MKSPRPQPASFLDLDKLKQLRLEHGLSQTQIAHKLGLKADWSWGIYETGKNHLPLWALRELYLQLNLDPLTLLELLRIPFPNPKTLRDFRRACQKENLSPAEALAELISTYSYAVLKKK